MPKLIKFLNYRFYTAQKNRSSRPETFYREAVQKRKKTTTTTARHGRIPSYRYKGGWNVLTHLSLQKNEVDTYRGS